MSFREAIRTCFAKYLVFSGRASRSENWYYFLFIFLIFSALGLITVFAASSVSFDVVVLAWIAAFILLLPPAWSASVRRLHDTGRSGFWVLPSLVVSVVYDPFFSSSWIPSDLPFVWSQIGFLVYLAYSVIVFVFALLPSDEHENKYGPNPLCNIAANNGVERGRPSHPEPAKAATEQTRTHRPEIERAAASASNFVATASIVPKEVSPDMSEIGSAEEKRRGNGMAKSEAKGAETASPSNEVTQPNEAQEAQHTDGPNSAASTTEQQEREQAARLVIEYDDEAAAAWEQVQDLPSEYSSRFLDTLGANPEQDPAALAASLHEEHQKLIRPYDNDEVNDALAQARTISSDAETEFRKAYALVGTRVSPDGILVKVEEKFGPTELTKQRLEQEERELREREAAVQKAEEQRKTKEQVRHLYEESRRRRPPEQHAANARALQMGDRWRKQDDEDVAALLRRAPINAERRRVERNLALAYLSIFLLMVFFLFLAFSS